MTKIVSAFLFECLVSTRQDKNICLLSDLFFRFYYFRMVRKAVSEIRRAGTEALVKALGPIGMARYSDAAC